MQITHYTEYMAQISAGSVTVQVPDDEELPVQIIINTGKMVIFRFDEFQEICKAVTESLKETGRELTE